MTNINFEDMQKRLERIEYLLALTSSPSALASSPLLRPLLLARIESELDAIPEREGAVVIRGAADGVTVEVQTTPGDAERVAEHCKFFARLGVEFEFDVQKPKPRAR